jgi:hypothetical protein
MPISVKCIECKRLLSKVSSFEPFTLEIKSRGKTLVRVVQGEIICPGCGMSHDVEDIYTRIIEAVNVFFTFPT